MPRPASSRMGSTAPVVPRHVGHGDEARALRDLGLEGGERLAAGRSRIGAIRTSAPEATSPPKRPGCSESVVTTSSPGAIPSPASTMLQPSVVAVVSAIDSSGALTRSASSARRRRAELQQLLE